MCLQLHRLFFQRGRLLLHRARLALGFLQQLVGAHTALQNLQVHSQRRHHAVQQGLLAFCQRLIGSQLQHPQQSLVAQHRQHRNHHRCGVTQAGAYAHVVGRRLGQQNRVAFHRALAHQAFADPEVLVQLLALAQRVATQQAQTMAIFLMNVESAMANVYQRRKLREQRLGQLGKTVNAL